MSVAAVRRSGAGGAGATSCSGATSRADAFALVAAALALACASPAPPPPVATSQPPPASELDGGFRSVEAAGQGLELDLPDADGWRHDGREARSFVAVHPATGSRLLIRAWMAVAIARPDDCEREMRLLRPELPALAPAERIEDRSLHVAGDHTARLVAGVVPSRAAASELEGHALLFGSDGRRCLALVYSTSARGMSAPRVIGERLGSMTRVTFERVRRLGIEERVQVPRR